MRQDFLQIIQSRTARISVGPSTVRGKGHAGVCKAAREFLRKVELAQFGTRNKKHFMTALDKTTEQLRRALPPAARKWGLARKVLNIFLRDCLYTLFLAETYHLRRSEDFYEMPLDSITVKQLRRSAKSRCLSRWPGVIHVTPRLSEEYQDAALDESRKQRLARPHLDALWWSFSRD